MLTCSILLCCVTTLVLNAALMLEWVVISGSLHPSLPVELGRQGEQGMRVAGNPPRRPREKEDGWAKDPPSTPESMRSRGIRVGGAPHLPRPVERLEQSGERGTPYLLREQQIKPDGRGAGDRTCTPGSRELEETCEGQGIPHQHR